MLVWRKKDAFASVLFSIPTNINNKNVVNVIIEQFIKFTKQKFVLLQSTSKYIIRHQVLPKQCSMLCWRGFSMSRFIFNEVTLKDKKFRLITALVTSICYF